MSFILKCLYQRGFLHGVALLTFVLTAVGGLTNTAAAQTTEERTRTAANSSSSGGSALGLWRVEAMLDQACKNLAQRYNLSPEQEKYTRALMTRRVKAFLADHENDLRSLLTQFAKAQFGGQADASTARQWAQTAMPIFDDAEKAILAGNKQWRRVLSEEQKATHDGDMAQMEVVFGTLRERFSRWENGGFDRVRDGFAGRRPRPRPEPTSEGRQGLTTVARTIGTPYRPGAEHYWDSYVRRFIEDHELDDAQQQSALTILNDSKLQATNYRQAHAEETAKARQELRELSKPDSDAEARAEAQKELRELSKPVTKIFNEMRARLDTIPTEAQKAANKKQQSKRREAQLAHIRDKMQKRKAAPLRTRTTSAPAGSQPARPAAKVPAPQQK